MVSSPVVIFFLIVGQFEDQVGAIFAIATLDITPDIPPSLHGELVCINCVFSSSHKSHLISFRSVFNVMLGNDLVRRF